jgi:excinuclease ABC subunit A
MPRAPAAIQIRDARQHNLRGLDLDIPLGKLTVVTGVSGSGKSSLAFDTLYAEGQRRYVETFSPYARQFLERMPRPQVGDIHGILPAIAIDQNHPVKTSRSTVGTMTEITDHAKVLYAQAATLTCAGCGQPVTLEDAAGLATRLMAEALGQDVLLGFVLGELADFGPEALRAEGVRRVREQGELVPLERARLRADDLAIVDRLRLAPGSRARLAGSLERSLGLGHGRAACVLADGRELPLAQGRRCARCDLSYPAPVPSLFSFNSPLGACPACRGFGRTVAIDPERVVPDPGLSLKQGAIRPWRTGLALECQRDLLRFCRARGVPTDAPFWSLSAHHRRWIMEGKDDWYGVRGFFEWLESRRYKVQARVTLARYRAYTTCEACGGSRLRPEALRYRLAGLTLAELYALPIAETLARLRAYQPPAALAPAAGLLLAEIRARLEYLVEVGLGYLSLDRQSRTLSGGEVQRVDLARALGARLVDTLYVLDEPSIGLHPRDVARLAGVLGRLRDRGNTLVVVEHDPDLIRAADHLLDLGPGPGEEGGRLLHQGPPEGLRGRAGSATGRLLFPGPDQAPPAARPRRPVVPERAIRIRGASQHNLAELDVDLPLGALVVVSGVSGSGKSTLVRDVLYRWARRARGELDERPGRCRAVEGLEAVDEVILVDQEGVPRSPAVTPASYTGAFGPIRKHFGGLPDSRRLGFGPGDFSLRGGRGRCPACQGAGFEKIEMQFLSDVFLPCAQCGGLRYREALLEVRDRGRSMADVLRMTVDEARDFFGPGSAAARALAGLQAVGLGYLRLGQPASTLSGGEAQRLKLAAFIGQGLGSARRGKKPGLGHLFLFDEPTTGLHAADVEVLLQALDRLLDQGHSVVVIEHNLEVIRAADWVIDLGPEGGEGGGRVVCQGPPERLTTCPASHTGRHLAGGLAKPALPPPERLPAAPAIAIQGAREHNLRDLDLAVPRGQLVVVTGVSGSGKSTLAFDILFAEGQRRYLDSVSAYARQYISQLPRPDVDRVSDLPPAVAVEQRLSRAGRRSTVATMTEIHHFLRLLFARLGVQHCPACRVPVAAQSPEELLAALREEHAGQEILLLAPLVAGRKGAHRELMEGALRRGLGPLRVDGRLCGPGELPELDRRREHRVEVAVGQLFPRGRDRRRERALLEAALEAGRGSVRALSARGESLHATDRACPGCGRGFAELDPRMFSWNSPHGQCPACLGLGVRGGEDGAPRCSRCGGVRLRPEALAVRVGAWGIGSFGALGVAEARQALAGLAPDAKLAPVSAPLLAEIGARLDFLERLGLGYLGLDRAGDSLSGGEAQRIRLAAQLGSNLRGVCYVVDEPTIGLHPRDGARLIEVLRELRDRGNSLVVVEHDEATIRAADQVIDLGPGAGVHGGRLVAQGRPAEIQRVPDSATGQALRRRADVRLPVPRPDGDALWVRGARLHNLQSVEVRVPLGRLTCVSGVSGSGKSSLVGGVLVPALEARLRGRPLPRGLLSDLQGAGSLDRILWVDQQPIGRTPRSNVATYTGVHDELRALFARLPEAQVRGYGPGRFSFNLRGGRCEHCQGQGQVRLEMAFLPEVSVTCEACGGARFDPDTLEVTYRGRSIAGVLALTAEEAAGLFESHPILAARLGLLAEVGLGYLRLGQTSPTLSGGEAQRLKLVAELGRGGAARTLYVLEEPTTGLHGQDVGRLMKLVGRLTGRGDTVLVVEHNLDVLAAADHLIDLGPEGGQGGGRVVAAGHPVEIARRLPPGSHTAVFLARRLGLSGGRRANRTTTSRAREKRSA